MGSLSFPVSRPICLKKWSEWQDLNLRPPRPERGALPDCATLRHDGCRLIQVRPSAGLTRRPWAASAVRFRYLGTRCLRMTAPPTTRVRGPTPLRSRDAARILAAGGLVAFPTETVYGLGADATDGRAVARLYEAKGRPAFNPLIAHVTDRRRRRRSRALTPTPQARGRVLAGPADARSAQDARLSGRRAGDRRPRHHRGARSRPQGRARYPRGVRQAGRRALRQPVRPCFADDRADTCWPICAAASISLSMAARRRSALNRPSSPVSMNRLLLRPGGVPREAIEQLSIGRLPGCRPPSTETTRRWRPACSPPIMRRTRRCGLMPQRVEPDEALLGFGSTSSTAPQTPRSALNLSQRGDLIEAAANLFSHLRALDGAGAEPSRSCRSRTTVLAKRSTTGSRAPRLRVSP